MQKVVDAFLEQGFSYFDTGYLYQGSEESLRETLVKRYPRERFQITTKLPLFMCKKPEDMQTIFTTSMERLGLGLLDFYFLHGLSKDTIKTADEFEAWDFLKKLKSEGKIRHYGFSFHDSPEVLDELLTQHPDVELVQLQINYLDWDGDVQSRRLYETVRKHSKPFTIMEPVKGGLLAGKGSSIEKVFKAYNPEASVASWAVRFAASLDGLAVMLSGMTDLDMLYDNAKTIKNLKPLSEEELEVIHKAVDVLRSTPRVPCTGCRYCVDHCPKKINIPALMDVYSEYLKYNAVSNNTEFQYQMAVMNGGKPSSCVACRACEKRCPQHIEISSVLKKLVPIYETGQELTKPDLG
jgi:predicted aldo/keto reductase-like oxidoreductase